MAKKKLQRVKFPYLKEIPEDNEGFLKQLKKLFLRQKFVGTVGGIIEKAIIKSIGKGSELSIQGWQSTLVFTADSYRQVSWSAGSDETIILLDGTVYTIAAGNTSNMTALTYIYLDIAISTTALQVSDTASDAIGTGKILVGVAQNNDDTGSNATFQIFGGKGGLLLTTENLAANTITANEIAANVITAAELSTGEIITLSAQIKNAIIQDAHITGTITVGKTDAKCTDPNADQTSASPQNIAWLSDSGNFGDMAWEDVVGLAKLDSTIIEGGYIKTSLLTADNIIAGTLTGRKIQTHIGAEAGIKMQVSDYEGIAHGYLEFWDDYGDAAILYSHKTTGDLHLEGADFVFWSGIILGGVRRTTWPSGGAGSLSELTIDVDKDWNAKSISNIKSITQGSPIGLIDFHLGKMRIPVGTDRYD